MAGHTLSDFWLARQIKRDLTRTDRVGGAARTDLPRECNCCIQIRSTRWRGRGVVIARLGRYWAMGDSWEHAEALVMKTKEGATW